MPMKAVAIVTLVFLAGGPAWSQTSEDLKNDWRNTDNVLTYGMGYSQNRYRTLKEINKQSVKRLVPVWNVSLASNYGEQAQPLVHDRVALMPE
jgi:alcohol dehydrogenase (cytochrome c)